MKLAEALIERATIQTRMAELKQRMGNYARVQEGDLPAEQPDVLLAEYNRLAERLLHLIQRINATNVATPLDASDPGGMQIAEAIAVRDVLRMRFGTLQNTVNATFNQRFGRNEIRYESTIDVPAWRAAADELAREQRELDTKIQGRNWTVDLLEE